MLPEMTDKEHRHLLRDIGNYCEIFNQSTSPNLGALNFFIPHQSNRHTLLSKSGMRSLQGGSRKIGRPVHIHQACTSFAHTRWTHLSQHVGNHQSSRPEESTESASLRCPPTLPNRSDCFDYRGTNHPGNESRFGLVEPDEL